MRPIGAYGQSVNRHPWGKAARFKAQPHLSGHDGGHTINLRQFALDGLVLHGRLKDIDGYTICLDTNLTQSLDKADQAEANTKKRIDKFIARKRLEAPIDTESQPQWTPLNPCLQLDLAAAGISSLIWATGFGYDFSWIKLPIFDRRGYPIYKRGVTGRTGLYFVGLRWLHTRGSGLFYGVGKDAQYIANRIQARKTALPRWGNAIQQLLGTPAHLFRNRQRAR